MDNNAKSVANTKRKAPKELGQNCLTPNMFRVGLKCPSNVSPSLRKMRLMNFE